MNKILRILGIISILALLLIPLAAAEFTPITATSDITLTWNNINIMYPPVNYSIA